MSYAKKEAKSSRNWFIGASIILASIVLLFITNNGTYFHSYYKEAGGFWKVLGYLATGAWYWFVWYYFPKHRNRKRWVEQQGKRIVFAGVLLIIALFAGFTFDIEKWVV